jgi:polysaccharide pyruvyl transferase WcaK-like protein
MMKLKSVLLLGSYGQTNLGDDLLMWNYLELLRERGFTKIYVNTNTIKNIPQAVQKAYPNLEFVETYKTSIMQYIMLIRKVDVVIYGGGTLYKELYKTTGRTPYSVITRLMVFNVLARVLGTKLYHLNIGIGSLKTRRGLAITRFALEAATKTIFRDKASYDFAALKLGVRADKIEKSTDGIFLNHVWEHPWHSKKIKTGRKQYKATVGINVLSDIPDWVDRKQYIKHMRDFVRRLLDDNYYVVFVPFQHDFNPRNDLIFTRKTFGSLLKTYKNYTILDEVPIDVASSYLQQCDVFVGMRFHSLLLSVVNQVPFVAVTYDTKCLRFINENDYDYYVELENLSADLLSLIFTRVRKDQEKIKKKLAAISKANYNEAEETLRKLKF